MLQVIDPSAIPAFRRALRAALTSSMPDTHIRTLTTPGGPIRNAKLLWHPDKKIWAYLSPTAYADRRWLCWYGVEIGTPGKPLQPAVEINLSNEPSDKQLNGRALVDPDGGEYFLGHKGSLGGGRGGQLTLKDFQRHIRGFAKDLIQLDELREEEAFVIGGLGQPDFLDRLQHYVAECARLRTAARGNRLASPPPSTKAGKGGFTAEPDQDGFVTPDPAEVRRIRRLHGRVVNALKLELGSKASNDSHSSMRPDLYIQRADNTLDVLFEVKAVSNTQSWFTALGQLVVYGAGQKKPPVRVLVCPAPLGAPGFHHALQELGVLLVTFEETAPKKFSFKGLSPSWRG